MSTRERLIDAALDLFLERGFEATTVDDIAERAGVGRTTFFRHFKSKEIVIFPEHGRIVESIRDRLAAATPETALVAVTEAARLVLTHYLTDGSRARARYRLTRQVPALRTREIASLLQYQRTFRTFLHEAMGGTSATALRAELMANAIVTAHNHVLRGWLRGHTSTPAAKAQFEDAITEVLRLFGGGGESDQKEATVLVLRTTRPLSEVLPALRHVAEPWNEPNL